MKKASYDLLLQDVNVLLAIAWPNQQFHSTAIAALSSRKRWATCALTQLGFIRLSSNPAAVATAKNPQEAASLLARLVADSLHVYVDAPCSDIRKSRMHICYGSRPSITPCLPRSIAD